ncbi:MAG: hypothetical protein K1000chlam2_01296 [Chlamydiae bacterium]|nr:hypothetical protein [Chlamydiota bacterium]
MDLQSTLLYISQNTDINRHDVPGVLFSATIGMAAIASLFSKSDMMKIPGVTVVMTAAYGIFNDMIACRDSIEYFTRFHTWQGQNLTNRTVMNLDPNLNAIVVGGLSTIALGGLAGLFFLMLSGNVDSESDKKIAEKQVDTRITARQLFPYLYIVTVITFVAAHFKARFAQQAMAAAPYVKYEGVPLDMQAAWEVCNVRNTTGYLGFAIGVPLICVGIIATRIWLYCRSQEPHEKRI